MRVADTAVAGGLAQAMFLKSPCATVLRVSLCRHFHLPGPCYSVSPCPASGPQMRRRVSWGPSPRRVPCSRRASLSFGHERRLDGHSSGDTISCGSEWFEGSSLGPGSLHGFAVSNGSPVGSPAGISSGHLGSPTISNPLAATSTEGLGHNGQLARSVNLPSAAGGRGTSSREIYVKTHPFGTLRRVMER